MDGNATKFPFIFDFPEKKEQVVCHPGKISPARGAYEGLLDNEESWGFPSVFDILLGLAPGRLRGWVRRTPAAGKILSTGVADQNESRPVKGGDSADTTNTSPRFL